MIVRKQLLSIFGQAVAAITERRIIILVADSRVIADALDNVLRVQFLNLGVSVKLIEVSDAQGKIGVSKEFNGLSLSGAHDKRWDVLLNRAVLKKVSKFTGGFNLFGVLRINAYDDSRRIQVIVESFGLAKEFGTEQNIFRGIFLAHGLDEADGHSTFDNHVSLWVARYDLFYDGTDSRGIKEIFLGVVIGRHGDNHEVRESIS